MMGICWYCYHGWSRPVADIYQEALKKLGGYEQSLHFGPSHIVWEDENFDTDSVQWCLDHLEEYRHDCSDEEIAVVKWSLEEMLKIPEEIRDCEPAEYDDEHPENYPPSCEVVKV